MHAANKAGNNRIKDMLAAYCVAWDEKEARKLKREAAALRWAGDASKRITKEEQVRV
jgi:hypothetical protein